MRIAFKLAFNDIKRTFKTVKIYLIMIMTAFFMLEVCSVVNGIAEAQGIGVTPFLYPLFVSNWSGSLYTILLIVVLMSDAPYECGAELYIGLRVKKELWYWGKIIYIIMIAFIYQVMMVVISVLGIITNLTFHWKWGGALEEYWRSVNIGITMDGAGSLGNLLDILPLKAVGLQFLMTVFISVFIGCIIFIVNTAFRNFSGTMIVGIFACLHLYFNDFQFFAVLNKLQGYVPISWINLQKDYGVFDYKMEIVILSVLIIGVCATGYCMTKKNILRIIDNR